MRSSSLPSKVLTSTPFLRILSMGPLSASCLAPLRRYRYPYFASPRSYPSPFWRWKSQSMVESARR